mmetsp:Transcript_13344/g.30988  ORF Transcript_13344/g.30988 Transcript_13344/m.30988 type:complete len:370 (+) Transcript_13344:452-1561(+)
MAGHSIWRCSNVESSINLSYMSCDVSTGLTMARRWVPLSSSTKSARYDFPKGTSFTGNGAMPSLMLFFLSSSTRSTSPSALTRRHCEKAGCRVPLMIRDADPTCNPTTGLSPCFQAGVRIRNWTPFGSSFDEKSSGRLYARTASMLKGRSLPLNFDSYIRDVCSTVVRSLAFRSWRFMALRIRSRLISRFSHISSSLISMSCSITESTCFAGAPPLRFPFISITSSASRPPLIRGRRFPAMFNIPLPITRVLPSPMILCSSTFRMRALSGTLICTLETSLVERPGAHVIGSVRFRPVPTAKVRMMLPPSSKPSPSRFCICTFSTIDAIFPHLFLSAATASEQAPPPGRQSPEAAARVFFAFPLLTPEMS